MDAGYLKQYIADNQLIDDILSKLNMHSVCWHDGKRYATCGFPDGDNKKGCVLYNSPALFTEAYTRNIKDSFGHSDIISLTCFIRKCYYSNAIKWLCETVGLDYYFNPQDDLPESIKWAQLMLSMQCYADIEVDEHLKPIDESILSYYLPYPVQKWIEQGISDNTQRMFEIGFDLQSERITIPIRDELGNLVGVKGRLYGDIPSDKIPKYLYLERCAKSKVLYGLDKTLEHIVKSGYVIVVESEKAVMQLWSQDYKNAVSIGGHTLSKSQVEMLTRLCVDVLLAFDKDVEDDVVKQECAKFIPCVDLFYIRDADNLLGEKESPTDDPEKWQKLLDESLYCYVR